MSSLGPAPRIGGAQAPGANGLQFFDGGAGAGQQPGANFGGAQSQPPQAPFQQPGNFAQPMAGQIGGQMGGQMGQMAPGNFPPPQSPSGTYDDDFENEPPLLEELGINLEHIIERMKGVLIPTKHLSEDVLKDADLSGPLVICLALGTCLLLAGKLQFGYIYGLAAGGSFGICMLINVMSQKEGIDLYRTMSILGYGLIPIVFLAICGVFVSLKSSFGTVLAAICIGWATVTSSGYFETATSMSNQRFLLAYPIGLVYTFFTLITIF